MNVYEIFNEAEFSKDFNKELNEEFKMVFGGYGNHRRFWPRYESPDKSMSFKLEEKYKDKDGNQVMKPTSGLSYGLSSGPGPYTDLWYAGDSTNAFLALFTEYSTKFDGEHLAKDDDFWNSSELGNKNIFMFMSRMARMFQLRLDGWSYPAHYQRQVLNRQEGDPEFATEATQSCMVLKSDHPLANNKIRVFIHMRINTVLVSIGKIEIIEADGPDLSTYKPISSSDIPPSGPLIGTVGEKISATGDFHFFSALFEIFFNNAEYFINKPLANLERLHRLFNHKKIISLSVLADEIKKNGISEATDERFKKILKMGVPEKLLALTD